MRVLIVEDNSRTSSLLKEGLENKHFAVDVCSDYESGLGASVDQDYDVVLLDRRLPGDKDGLEICYQMRKANISTPVIILTAQGEIADKVLGLRQGADDYIVKPFSLSELTARIQAIMRRPRTFGGLELKVDDLVLDNASHKVFRDKKEIILTPKEFSILFNLMQNKGIPLSKDYLVSHVWDSEADILANSIETYISGLRKKIDTAYPKSPKLIQTVWGVGYKISDPGDV